MVRTDRDGLGARVSPKGKITFQLRYYYNGSEAAKRVDLGSYPAMPLVEARQETLRLRGLIEKGRYIEANPLADITGHEDLQIGSTCVDWEHLTRLFAESRAEAQPTRRRFDSRQPLDLPGIAGPAATGRVDQLLLKAARHHGDMTTEMPVE
jgi:hypothetical protein